MARDWQAGRVCLHLALRCAAKAYQDPLVVRSFDGEGRRHVIAPVPVDAASVNIEGLGEQSAEAIGQGTWREDKQ